MNLKEEEYIRESPRTINITYKKVDTNFVKGGKKTSLVKINTMTF